jgi:hypothetical protein
MIDDTLLTSRWRDSLAATNGNVWMVKTDNMMLHASYAICASFFVGLQIHRADPARGFRSGRWINQKKL